MLEEGVATLSDIDLGMMTGRGHPARAVRAGRPARVWTTSCRRWSGAEAEWGEHFAPPRILRRLVAQGRLGKKTGPGFLPVPAARPGLDQSAR